MSSISFWELGIKQQQGKIDLGVTFDAFCDSVQSTGVLEVVPVTLEVWQENLRLKWDHRDPADRTIVATAQLREAPIVTADTTISGFYEKTIW